MKVLLDHHHGALLRSMYYLWGKRFGFDLYLPTEMEWLDQEGLYSNYPQRGTSNQMLNVWRHDAFFLEHFKPILLEEFADTEFDIIVATLLENYKIYEAMIKKYNKKAKLVLHIGNNNWPEQLEQMGVKNLLSSSWPTYLKAKIPNKVLSRQEFSLEWFKPKFDCNIKSVANYKHILVKDELDKFLLLEKELPDWEFKMYGTSNRDGSICQDEPIMSESIRNFGFVYHYKTIDEGYGHCIHNAFACGKPVITSPRTMAVNWHEENIPITPSFIFENDKTILNLDTNSTVSLTYKLKKMADNYPYYSQYTYDKFRQVVNFDKEFEDIKVFVQNLI